MITLGRFLGPNGEIEVVEFLRDGSRAYFEEGLWQSQVSREGESVFTYIRIMEYFLRPASNVLLLGCGGGTLARSLARVGKRVTVVDVNPISFVIAERFFGLPRSVTCITSDFRAYIRRCSERYDGIAIDVGGPGFSFEKSFDDLTCSLIRSRLTAGGRILMNALVWHDLDTIADRIGERLSGGALRCWILDEPGILHRNAVMACLPEGMRPSQEALTNISNANEENWRIRKLRI